MTDNLYGPLISGDDVHNAVTEFIKNWSPSYINEAGFRAGFTRSDLPKFRSYTNVDEMDKFPEDGLPAVITFIPGTADIPEGEGDGNFSALFSVGIGVVVKSKDAETTRRLKMVYLLAIRALFIQHPSVDFFANNTAWLGETYDILQHEDSRTIQAGVVNLEIQVNNVVSSNGGLQTPPIDPEVDPGNYGLVETTNIEIEDMQ